MASKNGKTNSEAGDSFEGGPATPGHNVAVIKEKIVNVRSRLDSIDAEMEELKAQKKEARAELKGMGVNMKEFDIARRYASFDDSDKRDEALDWLRVCFEALNVGDQGSLFPPPSVGEAAQASA